MSNEENYSSLLSVTNLKDSRTTKVFVVGFLKTTTESELTQIFSEYGPIKEVHIVRDRSGISKCFGFVTFEHFDGAAAALQEETKYFQDRELHCKLATDASKQSNNRGGAPSGSTGSPSMFGSSGASSSREGEMTPEADLALRRLFCRNLSSMTTEDSFKQFFEQFGETENNQLARHKETGMLRGFGFVTYRSRVDAMRCLESQSKFLDGNELSLNLAEKDPKLCGGCQGHEEILRKLFIRGLTYDSTDDTLLNLMSMFGEIESCYISKSKDGKPKGYGFCIYKSPVSAMQCLEEPRKTLDGKPIFVNLAEIGRREKDPNQNSFSARQGYNGGGNRSNPVQIGIGVPAANLSARGVGVQPYYIVPQAVQGNNVQLGNVQRVQVPVSQLYGASGGPQQSQYSQQQQRYNNSGFQ